MAKEFIQAEVNIGLIGHVDHGKTSITQALSGTWTDTHSEELKRGISIRLGYADATFYKCPKCKGSESFSSSPKCPNCSSKGKPLRRVSFVDAPGHETLMATMLSGAALMHGAILVIAANEACPQPRTAEHLIALQVSEVKNIVIAQNKVDLVDRKAAVQNHKEIRDFLKKYGYGQAPIIPIAANFGANLDLLIEAIEKNIPSPKLDKKKPLKMFVARSFDVNKPGAKPEELQGGVLGGTIMQGSVKNLDPIEIAPGTEGKKILTKVVDLSTSAGKLKQAEPGGLIAIKTTLDPSKTQNDQMRGQVVGVAGSLPEPIKKIRIKTHAFKRLLEVKDSELKVNEVVVLTIGTLTLVGTIENKKNDLLEIGLRNPVIVEENQRIAVSKKSPSGWRLVAYGVCSGS